MFTPCILRSEIDTALFDEVKQGSSLYNRADGMVGMVFQVFCLKSLHRVKSKEFRSVPNHPRGGIRKHFSVSHR